MEGGEGHKKDIRQEKVEPFLKNVEPCVKKKTSFQQRGQRAIPWLLDTERRSSPGPRAFPAILIIHNENSEKSLPTSKLTTIAESEAGFLSPSAAPSV